MIRWVKAHPYTTATPFMLAAIGFAFWLATGVPWWRCVLFVVLVSGAAAANEAWKRKP